MLLRATFRRKQGKASKCSCGYSAQAKGEAKQGIPCSSAVALVKQRGLKTFSMQVPWLSNVRLGEANLARKPLPWLFTYAKGGKLIQMQFPWLFTFAKGGKPSSNAAALAIHLV